MTGIIHPNQIKMAPVPVYAVLGKPNHYYICNDLGEFAILNNSTGDQQVLEPSAYHTYFISGAYAAYDADVPVSLSIDSSCWFGIISEHVSSDFFCRKSLTLKYEKRAYESYDCRKKSTKTTMQSYASTWNSSSLPSRMLMGGTWCTHGTSSPMLG